MSSSLRRGALAASAIAFSIASLAACGAGNNSQTLEIKPDNAATSVGDIKIQNAVVITQPEAEATGPAAISATVFNSGSSAQTLDSITVDGVGGPVELSPAQGKGGLTVPAGGSVIIGGEGNASAVLPDGASLTDGDAHKVTFAFSKTGEVVLDAFIVPAEGYYASWGPSATPEAPATEESPEATETGETGETEEPGGDTNSPEAPETGTATETATGEASGH
ncbi:DUF461 domain-containing protein [Streptomyces sp. NPDC057877]|uniref:DUF461 domain-containing protein n=1 Tax=Streptomyces sp. NPDC057877 TaxID=3346269 RepID=UPI0036D008CB